MIILTNNIEKDNNYINNFRDRYINNYIKYENDINNFNKKAKILFNTKKEKYYTVVIMLMKSPIPKDYIYKRNNI